MAKPRRSLDVISGIVHKSYTDVVGVKSMSVEQTHNAEDNVMSMEYTYNVEDKGMSTENTYSTENKGMSTKNTHNTEDKGISAEHTHTVEGESMSTKHTHKTDIVRRSEAPERKSQRLNLLARPSFAAWAKETCKSQGYSLNDAIFEGLQLWAAERGCAPYEGSKKLDRE